jgi:thiosulfate/3-mercaptopyruvate sulfurtransferase
VKPKFNLNQLLVSSEWLHENLGNPNLVILDASQKSNTSDLRIQGSRFFDMKNVFCDQTSEFPNTFPSTAQFETGCRDLGINSTSEIVVYDNLGIYSSPRVWWMFKTFGHKKVYVLNGGLPDWIEKGFETENAIESSYENGDFKAKLSTENIKEFSFIKSNIALGTHLLIDARSKGRFDGTAEEPRAGLRSGHIPASINIPFSRLLENGMFKSEIELRKIFQVANVDNRPLIFSCGSGVTACIVLLASELVLENPTAVYDGSWTEWATLV